jgi:hypothetical protein
MPKSRNGKRILVRSVQAAGLNKEKSVEVVNLVVDLWKKAIFRGEHIETPIGLIAMIPKEKKIMFSMKPLLKSQTHVRIRNRNQIRLSLTKKKVNLFNEPN